jgi:DNA-directed RNA polymerase specialized sigma subunit
MSEILLREHIEIERQRDAFRANDRINDVERSVAVLETRLATAVDTLFKELGRSVSSEDLKEVKREMELKIKEATGGLREYILAANDQQANNILHKVETIMGGMSASAQQAADENRKERERDNRQLRNQFILMMAGTGASIIGTILFLKG